MQTHSQRSQRSQGHGIPFSLGAGIGLVTVLFVAAVFFFLTRDIPGFDLLRTFAPASQADYAFTLEQRVAPQRATRGD